MSIRQSSFSFDRTEIRLASLAAMPGLVALVVCTALFKPLLMLGISEGGRMALTLGVLSIPLGLLTALFCRGRDISLFRALPPGLGGTYDFKLLPETGFHAGLVMLLLGAFLASNQLMDSSSANLYNVVVTDTYKSKRKSGYTYEAAFQIPSDVGDPTREGRVNLSASDYATTATGSIMDVSIRRGFWGLPWVSGHTMRRRIALAPQKTSVTESPDENLRATQKAAIEWRVPSSQSTTAISDVATQHWPNGQIMQEEPQDGGKPHGLARYWHMNGKPYASIPWWHGEKHGRFRLYRDNGTLEQSLSYKSGQPHGVLCWYGDDGKTKTSSALYVDGVWQQSLTVRLPDCP